jgi:2-polyprenyl-3-methyl-5-hydroxy-6-metoxy-1,4-benzoquinol methylase
LSEQQGEGTVRPTLRADEIVYWVKGPRILDVGCTSHTLEVGSPHWLHGRLREMFPSVAGIDISAENVGTLKKMGFDNLYVQSAECFELSEKFDTIVAGELVEHLANPGLFLQQARRHLNNQGTVVLTTPNPFSLEYFLYAILKFPKTCQNLEHACWFCPRTMTELAERGGFKVVHFELIDDYRSDDPSFLYRLFSGLMMFFSPILPKRLRKTMLFVLALNGDPVRP